MMISIDIPKVSVSQEQYERAIEIIEGVISDIVGNDVPADIIWEDYE